LPYLTAGEGEVRLAVRVQPRASRDRICGVHGDRIKLQLTAPPVEGAANAAVLALIAAWLAVPKRAVSLVRGGTSREKTIAIATDQPAQLSAKIEAKLSGKEVDPSPRDRL
jgi:uncharacterized protein (TIGR00251 family)